MANLRAAVRSLISLTRPASLGAMAVISALSIAPTSHAQLGAAAGFKESFTPDFMSRDMDLFVEFLQLEPWQQPIVQALLADYQDDFKAGVDGMRERMQSIRDKITGDDRSAIAVVMQPINAWSAEKKALGVKFLENVRSQLSDEQMRDHWPRLERALRRDKDLPRGELSGESTDLLVIAREKDVPPAEMEAAKDAFERYEVHLDAALAARSKQLDESQPLIKQAMIDNDLNLGLRELEKIVAARIVVRTAQDSGLADVSSALGEPWGETLRDEALRRGFAIAYRTTSLESFFVEALSLEGLTPEQATQIETLRDEYLSQFVSLTARIVERQRTVEPEQQTRSVRQSLARQNGQSPAKPLENPYSDLQSERDSLAEKYRLLVAAILGDELTGMLNGAAKFDREEAGREAAESGREAAAAERDAKASSRDGQRGLSGAGGAGRGGRGGGQPAGAGAAGGSGAADTPPNGAID